MLLYISMYSSLRLLRMGIRKISRRTRRRINRTLKYCYRSLNKLKKDIQEIKGKRLKERLKKDLLNKYVNRRIRGGIILPPLGALFSKRGMYKMLMGPIFRKQFLLYYYHYFRKLVHSVIKSYAKFWS